VLGPKRERGGGLFVCLWATGHDPCRSCEMDFLNGGWVMGDGHERRSWVRAE
jgi:hypothetical protein